MEIVLKEKTYQVKYGFKALMIYENITGESFSPNGLNSLITLFYCCVMAGNKDLAIEFDDFVNELDERPEVLTEFSTYIVEMLTKNNSMSDKETKSDDKKKVTKEKKQK